MIVFFEYVNLNYAHFCEYLTVAVPFTLVFITGETMAMADFLFDTGNISKL